MAYWLMKSEPFKYSWEDLVRDGRTQWDGVRNHMAKTFLKSMAVGDGFLFYHSNEGKAVVGIGEIIGTAEPDPTVTPDELTKDGANPWVVVTVAPDTPLPRPVTLEELRGVKGLEEMALFRYSRLSVQPVTPQEWRLILGVAGVKG